MITWASWLLIYILCCSGWNLINYFTAETTKKQHTRSRLWEKHTDCSTFCNHVTLDIVAMLCVWQCTAPSGTILSAAWWVMATIYGIRSTSLQGIIVTAAQCCPTINIISIYPNYSGLSHQRLPWCQWSNPESYGYSTIVHSMIDSRVHGANMGPTWVLPAPGGPKLAP